MDNFTSAMLTMIGLATAGIAILLKVVPYITDKIMAINWKREK